MDRDEKVATGASLALWVLDDKKASAEAGEDDSGGSANYSRERIRG